MKILVSFKKKNLSLFMSKYFLSYVFIYITDSKLELREVNRIA